MKRKENKAKIKKMEKEDRKDQKQKQKRGKKKKEALHNIEVKHEVLTRDGKVGDHKIQDSRYVRHPLIR